MGSRKKTGAATTGARRKSSPRGGRTSTTAGSGKSRAGRRLTTPTPSTPAAPVAPSPVQTRRSHSRSSVADRYVAGPFWSDASQAWRVEYVERDESMPGGWWEGSFYCGRLEDAEHLAVASRKVKSREDWMYLRRDAISLAIVQGAGFLYRVMHGEREAFNNVPCPPGRR